MRPGLVGKGSSDGDYGGRMHLVQRHQRGAGGNGFDGATAVFQHISTVVTAAQPDIQAGEQPRRHAAASGEEPVARTSQRRDGEEIYSLARHRISSSA